MKKLLLLIALCLSIVAQAAKSYDNPDTIIVARDGTGEFRTVDEAIEVCRAFMDYHKVIYIKKGIYKEKLIIPQWLQNIELCGEDRDETIITYDDHANVKIILGKASPHEQAMGTFRTYTLKIEANDITLKNLTIENNSARLGQAVALHTEGDRLIFVNCRFIGHQDTVYTGMPYTRLFSRIVTSAVRPTLSSALQRLGLRTVPSRVSSTVMSPQPLHLLMLPMAISLISVNSLRKMGSTRYILDVLGETMAIRFS